MSGRSPPRPVTARRLSHSLAGTVNQDLHYDYTAVGHVTIDVFDDGSRRAGGTALFSALQASRLGRRALIVTRGVPEEIDAMIAPFAGEVDVRVTEAPHTTTLHTSGAGADRRQRVLAWAGPIERDLAVATSILHLAPVARETPARWRGGARFVGLTPQGLARDWAGEGAEIVSVEPAAATAAALARHCDALVLSEYERPSCTKLIAAAHGAGAVVAVTAGARPTTILVANEEPVEIPAPALAQPVEDIGAGDVFAAAFFVALADGEQPRRAARFAAAAAAVRMRAAGAGAIGDRAEIEAQLRLSAPGR